jgi:hypothetical protein
MKRSGGWNPGVRAGRNPDDLWRFLASLGLVKHLNSNA